MAHKEDDRWIVDERLTNAVSRPLSTTNIGVVVLEVQEGSPATRMINIEDGTAWKLEAGDIITHIDGADSDRGAAPQCPCRAAHDHLEGCGWAEWANANL